MKTCSAATAITDTQQENHQSNMEYSHSETNTIHSNIANQASAILTNLQSNTCLIKCWNLKSQQRDYLPPASTVQCACSGIYTVSQKTRQ